MKIIEHCTKMKKDFLVTGKLRLWVNLEKHVAALSLKYGRRGISLQLPPRWPVMGSWILELRNGGAYITHRWSGAWLRLDRNTLPKSVSIDMLYVEHNWSEGSAFIAVRNDPTAEPVNLYNKFVQESVEFTNDKIIEAELRTPKKAEPMSLTSGSSSVEQTLAAVSRVLPATDPPALARDRPRSPRNANRSADGAVNAASAESGSRTREPVAAPAVVGAAEVDVDEATLGGRGNGAAGDVLDEADLEAPPPEVA